MILDKILYKAQVKTTGGRDGHATSSDGILDVKLVVPKEMGGAGGGTNPEQLFGAGYSACFIGAMKYVAGKEKITVSPDTSVTAIVSLGQIPGGFGLAVELQILLPGLDRAVAMDLVEKAHHVCPYSNATRGNIEVRSVIL